MSNTTPFPYRRYLSPATAHLEPIIEWYESALGDQDHATEVDGHAYYAGVVDAHMETLVLALSVPDEHINAYLQGGMPPEPEPQPPASGIEVLVVRDPDTWDDVTVFVDGQRVNFTQQDVDPGAGHLLSDWDKETDTVANEEHYSPAFRAAVIAARQGYRTNQYIQEDGEDDE